MFTARNGFLTLLILLVVLSALASLFKLMFGHIQENFEDDETPGPVVEVVTPKKLKKDKLTGDVDTIERIANQFLEWLKKHKKEMDKNSTVYTDIDVESILEYKALLAEQKEHLESFAKHDCGTFKKQQKHKTSQSVFELANKHDMSPKEFNQKLDVCYRVYAPTEEVVLYDYATFHHNIVNMLDVYSLISNRFELEVHTLNNITPKLKNELVHQIAQFSSVCKENSRVIGDILERERLMREERVYHYDTNSIFIRPNNY